MTAQNSRAAAACTFFNFVGLRGVLLAGPTQDRTVCVYYFRTYYKAVRGGGRRRVDDMCYDRRRAEACVDESAHHAHRSSITGVTKLFAWGGGGELTTCAMIDDEPRHVWMSPLITRGRSRASRA